MGPEEIPEDLPRSREPTCELRGGGDDGVNDDACDDDDDDEQLMVVALRDIALGEVLCIAPLAEVNYREVEVDLASGELVGS